MWERLWFKVASYTAIWCLQKYAPPFLNYLIKHIELLFSIGFIFSVNFSTCTGLS